MYTVIWDDYSGNRNELTFETREDARIEAEALGGKYDFVDIINGRG